MRIIAGISNAHRPDEIAAYAAAGLDEVFIGYVPKDWSEKYGWELSPNRRETTSYNYKSKEEILNVVDLTHKHQKKIYLTLNSHEYSLKQINLLYKILNDIVDVPFDGFIVSNPAIMLQLHEWGFEKEINVSIGGGCNNIEAVEFYLSSFKNIGRIILPRKLTIKEIEIISAYGREKNIRLEAFGMSECCYFNDEYCYTWHGAMNLALCHSPMYSSKKPNPILFNAGWKESMSKPDLAELYKKKLEIETRIEDEREAYKKSHPSALRNADALTMLPILANIEKCGLCTFSLFREWGIEAVKLPLRGHYFSLNLELIKIVRTVLDHPDATPGFCKKVLNSPHFCSGKNCYYDYPFST